MHYFLFCLDLNEIILIIMIPVLFVLLHQGLARPQEEAMGCVLHFLTWQ